MEDEWWSVSQCADTAKVSEWAVRRWLRNGRLQRCGVKVRRPGKAWQIDSDSYLLWLLEVTDYVGKPASVAD